MRRLLSFLSILLLTVVVCAPVLAGDTILPGDEPPPCENCLTTQGDTILPGILETLSIIFIR